jgi:uncharacterized protein YbgA (DUF1722 family)/uncharacterized protein YbbK (DUF523 family)
MKTASTTGTIQLGISMCLLGEKVRFDGGHKRERFLTDVLGEYFSWVPVCPELEVGMGIPREAVRLVGTPARPQMVGVRSGEEWTERMETYSEKRVREIAALDLSGFIFKSDSPSCGMERVKVYAKNGMPSKTGRGLFAQVFMRESPLVPVEEEGRLNDARIRDNFIVRVFSYHRYQRLLKNYSRRALVEFHTVHKYLMLAHSPKHYDELGRLVARQASMAPAELKAQYGTLFMEGLSVLSTAKKNTNVLQHILGFLRESLTEGERNDILAQIEDYRTELVPLVVPLTLIKHYVKKHRIRYIEDQIYLNPHPKELMLRNHV